MFLSLIDREKIKRALLHGLYLLVVLLFQDLILSHVAPLGVRAMFVPAAVVAAGMFEGGVWGAVFGLAAGLLCDMTFTENTALFTVIFPVFGFFSGVLTQYLATKRFVAYLPVAFLAIVITAVLQMVGLWIADDSPFWVFLKTALLQIAWSTFLAVPLYYPCRAIHGGIID